MDRVISQEKIKQVKHVKNIHLVVVKMNNGTKKVFRSKAKNLVKHIAKSTKTDYILL
ncbi:hypothetical protein YC2023_022583 [Brassica napus]